MGSNTRPAPRGVVLADLIPPPRERRRLLNARRMRDVAAGRPRPVHVCPVDGCRLVHPVAT